MPFIVPGVCRFTINGTYFGRNTANVLDMQIDTTGEITDRNDAIVDQAEVIIQEWSDSVLVSLMDNYVAQNVSWVDLDDADGSTGSTTNASGASDWPRAGSVATNGMPGQVSMLVRKQTASGRARRDGRMYVPGVPEGVTVDADANRIDPATLAIFQTRFDAFLGDINQDGGGAVVYTSQLAVVHILTRGPVVPPAQQGPPLTGDFRGVESLQVQALLATQRRRLRG